MPADVPTERAVRKPDDSGSGASAGGLSARLGLRRNGGFELDVALTIEPGTTTALLGPNGAGKSTVVDTLAGMVAIETGRIELGGRCLDDPERRVFVAPEDRRIGVVFQRYLLFDHMSVADNVAFGPRSRRLGRRVAAERSRHWMEAVGIDGLAERRPPELSGGQAQRVALARALATDPELLLLDEPLAAVDIDARSGLRRLLMAHLETFAGPRLVITHDPAEAFLLADTIVVMEHGRITQVGSSEDIRRRPATGYVAALAGTNLLIGTNDGGRLTLNDHPLTLQTSDAHTSGPVAITIHPNAVSLHPDQPHGSPRNTWLTEVAAVEELGETTRIMLGDPLPIGVDITPAATAALALSVGSPIWASVKATEITVHPT